MAFGGRLQRLLPFVRHDRATKDFVFGAKDFVSVTKQNVFGAKHFVFEAKQNVFASKNGSF
jgi:hypothetical protein